MYRIKAFSNASEFNNIFGIVERDNGTKSRRNLILLAFYKHKEVWNYCKKKNCYGLFFSIKNMAQLKVIVMDCIRKEMYYNSRKFPYRLLLNDVEYFSGTFETDCCNGIPLNGDVNYVRYITHESNRDGKVYRMRAGRLYKRLLLETELGQALPQQVVNWLCEEFTKEWQSYVTRLLPKFTLRVDDNFQRIYSYCGADGCTKEFGSCMMDDNQHHFYEECIECKAASLVNEQGKIIARCIIYTNVKDEDGKVWRLAERQYSEYSSDLLKRCLVDALIDGGYIDGYKQVGVDCHCTRAFVDKDGNSLADKKFYIDNKLLLSENYDDAWNADECHILSYQDSFKFYDYKSHKAYNYYPETASSVRDLDTTESYLQGYYDEYHDDYCSNYCRVYWKGRLIKCDYYRTEDFIDFNGQYVHKDEFTSVCAECGNKIPSIELYGNMAFMREHNGKYFCCTRCNNKYIDRTSFYDDARGCYVSNDEDTMVKVLYLCLGDVNEIRISLSCLHNYIERGKVKVFHIEGMFGCNPVPMWSDGLTNPRVRFEKYLREHRQRVLEKSENIIAQNILNDVNETLRDYAVELRCETTNV